MPGPAGKLDAVLVEGNGGATTSFWYDVFVVPRGDKAKDRTTVAYLYGAVRSDSAYGVNVKWADAGHLVVEYLEADQTELVRSPIVVEGEQVMVSLQKGVRDQSAPPGGMLYNLRGRR